MRRWALNIFAGISLALFLAMAAFWAYSYITVINCVFHQTPPDNIPTDPADRSLTSSLGQIRFATNYRVTREANAATANWQWAWLGFSSGDEGPPPAGPGIYARYRWLVIPYWALAMLSGIAAFITVKLFAARRRQEHRLRNGLCAHCGYDLQASPERCPECGMGVVIQGQEERA